MRFPLYSMMYPVSARNIRSSLQILCLCAGFLFELPLLIVCFNFRTGTARRNVSKHTHTDRAKEKGRRKVATVNR